MFKFCPNCTKETMPEWKCCPYCGFMLVEADAAVSEDTTTSSAIDDAIGSLIDFANEEHGKQEQNNKLRVNIIRGKYDEAKRVCDELIENDPMDKVGYIGLIRIASKNYKEYEGAEIAEQIRIIEEIFGGADELLSDPEYAQYVTARKQYFEEKERRCKEAEEAEAERKRKEAEEARRRAEEERKASEARLLVLLRDSFYFKKNSDGTYKITGVVDPDIYYIDIPKNVSIIGANAFEGCEGLTEVEIPYGVKTIGDEAFQNCCNLESVSISGTVKSIGDDAFYGCDNLSNVSITLSSELAKNGIKGYFPDDCTIEVSFADDVTEIGDNAFEGCEGLTEVEIPYGVKTIGDEAFQNCCNLESVSISGTVKSIGDDAFYGCDNLSLVTLAYDCPLSKADIMVMLPDDCEIRRE